MPPLISCVVPTFNAERHITETLQSILAQTYRPIEVIVADDGSTDGTLATVREYGDDVRIVSQSTSGPAATRNLGLNAAHGALVAFLDADDLWHKEKLARQAALFTARPEIDLCLTYAQMFWASDLRHEADAYQDHPRAQPLPGYATTTLLARRALFETVGMFDTNLWFADATDWFIRAADVGAVMEIVPEVLTYHRMHHTNLTRRRSDASRAEFLHVVMGSLRRRRGQDQVLSELYQFPGTALSPRV
jgi:glycosyltransferase involved in cell wall biosynthesis